MKLPLLRRMTIDHVLAGQRIRALREKRGVTLRDLARRMSLSASYLSDLERGRRNWIEPHWRKAVHILNKLNNT